MSTKAQLKKLRDDLVAQSQQARTFPLAPAELVRRLHNVATRVGAAYQQCNSPFTQRTPEVEEVFDDALVEGHLALSDWNSWVAQHQPRKSHPAAVATPERRVHQRDHTILSIKLMNHHLRDDGLALVVDDETVDCPTRDVSLGGAFVLIAPGDLPALVTGQVLHVTLPAASGAPEHKARAIVIRRDAVGVALRWIVESPADKLAAESMVSAIRTRWLAPPG